MEKLTEFRLGRLFCPFPLASLYLVLFIFLADLFLRGLKVFSFKHESCLFAAVMFRKLSTGQHLVSRQFSSSDLGGMWKSEAQDYGRFLTPKTVYCRYLREYILMSLCLLNFIWGTNKPRISQPC